MEVKQDINLSKITYYGIGGNAKIFIEASSIEEVIEALEFIKINKLSPVYILGLGCNLLLPDEDLDGVVLHITGDNSSLQIDGKYIVAFAGVKIADLIDFSFTHNLAGLAWAGGLPSTVGGAVRGNAGCFGSEIKDTISTVGYIDLSDPQLKLQTIDQSQCEFAYRDSYFKHNPNLIIVTATFKLQKADAIEIEKQKEICQTNIDYRKSHHPLEYPSCGSVFKNINQLDQVQRIIQVWPDVELLVKTKWYGKVSMAYIIGRLGFAGYKVGGAQVSEKHNNYISNMGNAKAEDVLTIINAIQDRFTQTFNFTPEPEVQILKVK